MLEHYQRAAVVGLHPGGTTDIQKVVMSRRIGIGRAAKEQAGRFALSEPHTWGLGKESTGMDLGLTEAQEILKATAADFVRQEYDKDTLIALENTLTGITPELFQQAADLGWLGILIPESYGGTDRSLTDRCPSCSRNWDAARFWVRIFHRACLAP